MLAPKEFLSSIRDTDWYLTFRLSYGRKNFKVLAILLLESIPVIRVMSFAAKFKTLAWYPPASIIKVYLFQCRKGIGRIIKQINKCRLKGAGSSKKK